MPQFLVDEAQLRIDELIELALAGEDVIITDGKDCVRLVPFVEDCARPL